jgi:DNA/RNA endonuclease YhcR with UshA esterase domain
MRTRIGILVAGFGLLLSGVTLAAHHSFAAEYDGNKPVTVKGVVTKVEWTNPHARFYVDVADASGRVTNWNFELGARTALARNGWTGQTLKVGDTVTVTGFEGRVSGTFRGNARSVVLADGRAVFAGSVDDDIPAGRP